MNTNPIINPQKEQGKFIINKKNNHFLHGAEMSEKLNE